MFNLSLVRALYSVFRSQSEYRNPAQKGQLTVSQWTQPRGPSGIPHEHWSDVAVVIYGYSLRVEATTVTTVNSLPILIDNPPKVKLVWVGMPNTVLADSLKDSTIVPPVQTPVGHVVRRGPVDHTRGVRVAHGFIVHLEHETVT